MAFRVVRIRAVGLWRLTYDVAGFSASASVVRCRVNPSALAPTPPLRVVLMRANLR